MIDLIRKYCEEIDYPRTKEDIFTHLVREVEELDEEINPDIPGPDGVFGESIDVILCAFDLIFRDNPDITNEEIMAYTLKKLEKWKAKYGN